MDSVGAQDMEATTATTQEGAVEASSTLPYGSGSTPVQAVEATRRPVAQAVGVLPSGGSIGGKYAGGLGTSFAGALFADPQHRSDCCHLALCGTLSHDRTQHLLWSDAEMANYRSPDWRRRVLLWIVVPLLLFVILPAIILSPADCKLPDTGSTTDGYGRDGFAEPRSYGSGQGNGRDDISEGCAIRLLLVAACEFGGIVFMVAMVVYAITVRTTARRKLIMRVLQANAGRATPGLSVNSEGYRRALYSHLNSLNHHNCCAHAVCGCVYEQPIPPSLFHTPEDAAAPPRSDFCTTLFHSVFKRWCCFDCFGCYFQCCGACALAQEEAEMERLLVNDDATTSRDRSRKSSHWIDYVTFQPFVDYFPDILNLRSTKTTSLLKHFQAISLLSKRLLVALLVYITIPCVYVLLVEPLLYGSEEPFNVLNLLVIFGTFAQAFFVIFLVHWIENRFDLSVDAVIKYFASGFLLSTSLAVCFETILSMVVSIIVVFLGVVEGVIQGPSDVPFDSSSSFEESKEEREWELKRNHPEIFVVQYFLGSFFVAALVEELCKYFGFWMMEHPDFVPPAEMEEALVAAETERPASTSTEGTEPSGDGLTSPLIPRQNNRTLTSLAAGTTVAMVTTAAGFACCENFLYVFFYSNGGTSFQREASTLLMRSILPVHPLVAAIQSIGVCRRDIEGDTKVGLGRIILPAIVLHGTFDFVAYLLSYLGEISSPPTSDYGTADEVSGLVSLLGLFLFLFMLGIVPLGFFYYFYCAHKQRRRINLLDTIQS